MSGHPVDEGSSVRGEWSEPIVGVVDGFCSIGATSSLERELAIEPLRAPAVAWPLGQ